MRRATGPQRKPPARTLTCFDDNRCYRRHGRRRQPRREPSFSTSTCPPRSACARPARDYPPEMRRLEKARETVDAWVDLAAPDSWDLPTLVALGQVDSIEVLNSRFGRRSQAADEGDGRPRDRQALSRAPRQRPLVAGHLFSACWSAGCGFRPCRERLGRRAESPRLQPRLRSR